MFGYILIILGVVLFIKNLNTYFNSRKILNAIYEYHIDCIDKDIDAVVEYGMMKHYLVSFFRIWDWSCEHMLPADKLEVVKPYIGISKEVGQND